jgi:hypothetical protein
VEAWARSFATRQEQLPEGPERNVVTVQPCVRRPENSESTSALAGGGSGEKGTKEDKSMSFCTLSGFRHFELNPLESMAGTTGLEPATSAVTAKLKTVTD